MTNQRQPLPDAHSSNTLLLTNLHHSAFENGGADLRHAIENQYGRVLRFIPITSFFRFLVVFPDPETAARVKSDLHNTVFKGNKVMKVYSGENTDTNHLMNPNAGQDANLLQVPALERNFLLSPPGSPPVGWVQPSESGPSTGGHHQAVLIDALSKLSNEDDDFMLDDARWNELDGQDREMDETTNGPRQRRLRKNQERVGKKGQITVQGAYTDPKDVEAYVRDKRRTTHVLTFSTDGIANDGGGMEWEVSLPVVVVEDHGSESDEESDDDETEEIEEEDDKSDATESSTSLGRGISAFSMSVTSDGDTEWSNESLASTRKHIPRTAMPPRC